jgi:hypothetical protein
MSIFKKIILKNFNNFGFIREHPHITQLKHYDKSVSYFKDKIVFFKDKEILNFLKLKSDKNGFIRLFRCNIFSVFFGKLAGLYLVSLSIYGIYQRVVHKNYINAFFPVFCVTLMLLSKFWERRSFFFIKRAVYSLCVDPTFQKLKVKSIIGTSFEMNTKDLAIVVPYFDKIICVDKKSKREFCLYLNFSNIPSNQCLNMVLGGYNIMLA